VIKLSKTKIKAKTNAWCFILIYALRKLNKTKYYLQCCDHNIKIVGWGCAMVGHTCYQWIVCQMGVCINMFCP